jgi:hypothetical protein
MRRKPERRREPFARGFMVVMGTPVTRPDATIATKISYAVDLTLSTATQDLSERPSSNTVAASLDQSGS